MRQRVHNILEVKFVAAQHPGGYFYYKGLYDGIKHFHPQCLSDTWARILLVDKQIPVFYTDEHSGKRCDRCDALLSADPLF